MSTYKYFICSTPNIIKHPVTFLLFKVNYYHNPPCPLMQRNVSKSNNFCNKLKELMKLLHPILKGYEEGRVSSSLLTLYISEALLCR